MSAAPGRYAVIGHPVAHSRSPFIHAAFAAQTGEALRYGRLDCAPEAFADTLRAFAAGRLQAPAEPGETEGGPAPGPAGGCNITVPFKFEALRLAAQTTPRAARAGAVNTLRFDAGGWLGDNTDGIGLVRDVCTSAGFDPAGRSLLLIGAGGASAGVLGPLIETRPARLVLANRTVAKAQALVESHADWAAAHGVSLQAAPLDDCGQGHDLVLNGSAASLTGAAVPVAASVLRPGALALDMMYGPAARPFLDWAAAHGAQGRDGLGMLVEQAAEAFMLWRGQRPLTAPVLRALRARVDAA